MSGGLQPILQATVGNCLSFEPLSFGQDNRAAPAVDVGKAWLSPHARSKRSDDRPNRRPEPERQQGYYDQIRPFVRPIIGLTLLERFGRRLPIDYRMRGVRSNFAGVDGGRLH